MRFTNAVAVQVKPMGAGRQALNTAMDQNAPRTLYQAGNADRLTCRVDQIGLGSWRRVAGGLCARGERQGGGNAKGDGFQAGHCFVPTVRCYEDRAFI
jgi:hypothetical protein